MPNLGFGCSVEFLVLPHFMFRFFGVIVATTLKGRTVKIKMVSRKGEKYQ